MGDWTSCYQFALLKPLLEMEDQREIVAEAMAVTMSLVVNLLLTADDVLAVWVLLDEELHYE